MAAERGPRNFEPVTLAHREADAWVAYYRHEWAGFLKAAVGMVDEGFGMGRVNTLRGAFHVLRANQLWAPVPDNDPDGAREQMRRFYTLVATTRGLTIDPTRAAALEVEWWRAHRAHQHGDPLLRDDLSSALTDLYAYVYSRPAADLSGAAEARVRAMDHSDAWVAAGCHADDPRIAEVRRELVESYSELRSVVGDPGS